MGALLLVAGGCRDSEGTRAPESVGSAPNPLLAAVTKDLRAFNPNLDRFAIMHLRVVDAFRGKGYVTIGYGVRDTSSYPGQMRDEAFGVFAVNDSLKRIWKTFEIIPTQRWRDWELHMLPGRIPAIARMADRQLRRRETWGDAGTLTA